MGTFRRPLEERMLDKFRVDKVHGCWLWTGAIDKKGYGVTADGGRGFHRNILAHRASWMIHCGEIPNGLCVCHSCDNPPCINPDHLFLGTYKDNHADMDRKGRRVLGQAKLTPIEVLTIRMLLSQGLKQQLLADTFGVTNAQVSQINRRHSWKKV